MKPNPPLSHGVQRWHAPNSGWIKVNWDASLEKDMGRMGYSAVVRDDLGLVVAAQSVTSLGSLDSSLAEVGAILKAIQLCVSLGLQRVIFEGDSKGVVDGIHSTTKDWSHKRMMLVDIRMQLQNVSQWWVEFVCREDNQVAHT